jgi:cell division protein FtsI/penicillin-binding protein 2
MAIDSTEMTPRLAGSLRARTVLAALTLIFVPAPCVGAGGHLQSAVNELMRGMSGVVVVSNPRTGAILAEWNHETAFQQAYAPGSTAKLVTSAVALENGLISPADRISCRRIPELLGEAYRCSHPAPTEPFTFIPALANSCNYFFAALSTRLDGATLLHGYSMFGLTESATAGGEHAAGGTLQISDEPAAKARAVLGESPVFVTPAQLLLAYSAVATRGTIYRLRRSGAPKKSLVILRRVRLKASTWASLEEGFEECVRSGTGQAAAVPGVRVAGKTGTAGAPDGSGVTHAWFVGYAPADSPRVALVVLLERGTGARDAAPLAGRILQRYFASKGSR